MLEITCVLDPKKTEPIYIQLYDYLKREIQSQRIATNSKLPSQRKLATHLNISRNTVDSAYQQLLAEGYIRSEARKGLFVENINSSFLGQKSEKYMESRETTPTSTEIQFDFRQDSVDLQSVPMKIWKKMITKALNKEHEELYLNGNSQGEIELRRVIAEYLFQSRGVNCLPEQIVIGAGTQYLLMILCSVIGRNVAYGLEEPGFHRARLVLKNEGIDCISIPLDDNGIDVTSLKKSNVKVAYVTPSHQFPYGTIMPISRRMELLQWAKDNGSFIIEDDYDGEFRYQGKPIPSLQGLDNHGNVIYLGTFSKSLFPSICISYMVLPMSLLESYQEKFSDYKQTVPRSQQYGLACYMKEKHWERHMNKIRNIYKRKHALLLESIHQVMGDKVEVIGAESGLHILLAPKNNMSEQALIHSAKQFGVKVYPMSTYYQEPPVDERPVVLLGFGGIGFDHIEKGIGLLKKAWFGK